MVLGVAIVVGLLGFFQVRTNRLREREQKLREDEQKLLKGMLEEISMGVETLVERGAEPQAGEHTAPEQYPPPGP